MNKQNHTETENIACFAYSKNLLDFLLKIGLISKEEHKKTVKMSAEHYHIKNMCLN